MIFIVFYLKTCDMLENWYTTVTLSATSPTMYRYTKTLKELFGGYDKVTQITHFWDYLENDFVDGVYEEEWYNRGTDVPFPCPDSAGLVKGRIWAVF